jgi:hypothetical protein
MCWHVEHDGFNWWAVRDDNGGFIKAENEHDAARICKSLNAD